MTRSSLLAVLALFGACGDDGGSSQGVDAPSPIDASSIDAPPEPKPSFTANAQVSGSLAIEDAGIRATFVTNTGTESSRVTLSLTEQSSSQSCAFTVRPKFVMFDSGSTSTRSFKTVLIDFATSTVDDDKCKWDDAHVLQQLSSQFGLYEIGFARATVAGDRPRVDVFLDSVQPFPNQTANITLPGGGQAFAMAADGTVNTATLVEPMAGTLLPALYKW
ncbi:MAG: hypothetical protein HOV81_18560 [Kofleriaceae bacterium]|nr:hypothetical protein [Kofleriaceae bacterium]